MWTLDALTTVVLSMETAELIMKLYLFMFKIEDVTTWYQSSRLEYLGAVGRLHVSGHTKLFLKSLLSHTASIVTIAYFCVN